MILPGVPRKKRIAFVEELIELLLSICLDGITEDEHSSLSDMIEKQMSSVMPAAAGEEDEQDQDDIEPPDC